MDFRLQQNPLIWTLDYNKTHQMDLAYILHRFYGLQGNLFTIVHNESTILGNLLIPCLHNNLK
jgi:predicted ferric reductase